MAVILMLTWSSAFRVPRSAARGTRHAARGTRHAARGTRHGSVAESSAGRPRSSMGRSRGWRRGGYLPAMPNELATAASAYLRSAGHQPVAWRTWGPEAFAEAARTDRPILLDIGAVWCHWCHVMDSESYEDPAVADFLNRHFICIKVDRDERPDVDARYQRAVQAMTGQGGWPLTAFLLPDGEVFYGGTYFPPDGRHGRPGFRSLLEQVVNVYRTQRDRVTQQGLALRRVLADHLDELAPGSADSDLLAETTEQMVQLSDPRYGGFGTQPKFPHPAALTFLLHRWWDTGEPRLRQMVERTLDGMARGGIHDQLGGGFHRYSVDARWVVPHFEKMACDNAELLKAYLDGYTAFGREDWAEVARGIVRWVREVLADPEGGYGASQDADVGLEDDGDYFTWTLAEAEAAIGDPRALELAAAWFDIGTAGEMQHDPSRNVLFCPEPFEVVAGRQGLDPEAARGLLAQAVERLRAARARRPAPQVDHSRYTGWNGMLAGALIRAGVVLEDDWALSHGLRTLSRMRAEHEDPTRLRHSPGGPGGLLDDQVQVALALVEAYEATAEPEWLAWSEALLDRVWSDYLDPDQGGLWDSLPAHDAPGLLHTRARPVQDAPTPSPNGVAALVAARLAELTQAPRWRERHRALVDAFAGAAPQLGVFGATFLLALDWTVSPPTHLTIFDGGPPGDADRMHRLALRRFLPRRVVQRVRPGQAGPLAPAIPPQTAFDPQGLARGIACIGSSCRPPAAGALPWAELLESLRSGPAQ
jgi:uncharacterized protein YyaL (SSP411 family)